MHYSNLGPVPCVLTLLLSLGADLALASGPAAESDAFDLGWLESRVEPEVFSTLQSETENFLKTCAKTQDFHICGRASFVRWAHFLEREDLERLHRSLTKVACRSDGPPECRELEIDFLYESNQATSDESEEASSPYPAVDSPYGQPVDLGAVEDSDIQLPWMVKNQETDAGGGLGLLEIDWNASGRSIIHFRTEDKSMGEFYNRQVLTPGLARYQNSANLFVTANYVEVSSILDLDIDWIGYSNTELSDVGNFPGRPTDRLVGLELNALYFIWDDLLGFDAIGLKLGQQRVQWGVADQFNPTNTINPNDLRDVLLFGQQASNLMAAFDVALGGPWILDVVWVPSFRAALLPKSGDVSVVSVDRIPFRDERLRWQLHVDRELADAFSKPTIVESIGAADPKLSLANQSAALRLSGLLGRQDIAVSYAYGFRDLPVPTSTVSTGLNEPYCVGDQCVDGLIANNVLLEYPRQQVVGLNLTGEIPMVGGGAPVGYRFEAALTIPEETRATIELRDVQVAGFPAQNGPYEYQAPDGGLPIVYERTPFLKWTLGFDYTLTRELYVNAMWVHGFVDEFGAGDWLIPGAADVRAGSSISSEQGDLLDCRGLGGDGAGQECITEWTRPKIADYLVLGADYRFAENRALLRLFAIWEISGYLYRYPDRLGQRETLMFYPWQPEAFSAVLFPQFSYFFSNGFEAEIGGLLAFGRDYTRFGDPAVGGSLIWSRFRVRY